MNSLLPRPLSIFYKLQLLCYLAKLVHFKTILPILSRLGTIRNIIQPFKNGPVYYHQQHLSAICQLPYLRGK
jgi:hypothetical protein